MPGTAVRAVLAFYGTIDQMSAPGSSLGYAMNSFLYNGERYGLE